MGLHTHYFFISYNNTWIFNPVTSLTVDIKKAQNKKLIYIRNTKECLKCLKLRFFSIIFNANKVLKSVFNNNLTTNSAIIELDVSSDLGKHRRWGSRCCCSSCGSCRTRESRIPQRKVENSLKSNNFSVTLSFLLFFLVCLIHFIFINFDVLTFHQVYYFQDSNPRPLGWKLSPLTTKPFFLA